jgi:N-carbamoylputrescine amidase
MRLALIQMTSDAGTNAGNVAKACDLIDKAAKDQPDLILLPEFFNTGYVFMYRDYRYFDLAERDDGPSITTIKDKARQHQTTVVATIYEEQSPGVYYDTAILVGSDGDILGKFRKIHPAANRALEKIYFRYGTKFPVFQVAEFKVGAVICYDLSFPESARCVALNGAELIMVPFASPAYYVAPHATSNPIEVVGNNSADRGIRRSPEATLLWNAQMMTRARENMVYLAPCNHGGKEMDSVMGGGSMIVDPRGRILEMVEEDEGIIWADLDLDEVRQARISHTQYRDRRPDLYKTITAEMDDLHP